MTTADAAVRIAVDAMGGDNAPGDVVSGAVAAAREGGVQILLVGDPAQVQAELSKHDAANLPIVVIPSEGIIVEGEAPAMALRQKPRASITRGYRTCEAGQGSRVGHHGLDRRGNGGGGSRAWAIGRR